MAVLPPTLYLLHVAGGDEDRFNHGRHGKHGREGTTNQTNLTNKEKRIGLVGPVSDYGSPPSWLRM